MLKYPCIAPHIAVRYVPEEGLFVLSEHNSDVFIGPLFGSLLKFLNGRYSLKEILRQLAGEHSEAEILYAIELLERNGCAVERSVSGVCHNPALTAYWTAGGGLPGKHRITVENHSSEDGALLTRLLAEQGLCASRGKRLTVLLVDDYLEPVLARFNKTALETSD